MSDYDVVVVGGGGAGLAAAIAAAGAGYRVLLAESQARLGGSTRLSGGVFYAGGTSVQAARGIVDSPAAVFHHYLTLNQWDVDAGVVARFCDLGPAALDWLIGLGVDYPPADLYQSGVDPVLRGHKPVGRGEAIVDALAASLKGLPIDVALGNRVDGLVVEEGRVRGVRARGEELSADAVVLTTGGFGQARDLIERYYSDAAAHGEWTWSMAAPGSRGDGLTLGEAVGAAITGHNRGLLLATTGFFRGHEPVTPGWLVYVDREGQRFVDELASYAVMSGVMKRHGGVCWAILDEATRVAAVDPVGGRPTSWTADVLAERAERGRVARAATVAGLATAIGVDAAGLEGTVERYNTDCALGRDRDLFKDPSAMRPIAAPPFYGVEVRPAVVMLTSTGLRIDTDARVLDRAGRPIGGLFAAGETCGNVLGERYVAGGNAIANAIVFGRVAGESAATSASRPA